jgi:hypothetical protein
MTHGLSYAPLITNPQNMFLVTREESGETETNGHIIKQSVAPALDLYKRVNRTCRQNQTPTADHLLGWALPRSI